MRHVVADPFSFTAMSLLHGCQIDGAETILQWLVSIQTNNGSVNVTANQPTPGWTTSLAWLAWRIHSLIRLLV